MSLVLRHSLFNQRFDNEIRHMSFSGWSIRKYLRYPFSFVSLSQVQLAILRDWHCNFATLRVKSSAHTLTILDHKQSYVFKFGLTEWGDYCVKKNYDTLNVCELPSSPLPIFLARDKKLLYSVESLVSGEIYPANVSIDLGKYVLNNLSDWYRDHFIQETIGDWLKRQVEVLSFLTKAQQKLVNKLNSVIMQYSDTKLDVTYIHGDVTYDNVIVRSNRLYLIDWDRSGIGLLEHELWLSAIYVRTKNRKYYDEKLFLFTMLDYLNSKQAEKVYEWIGITYDGFSINTSVPHIVQALFMLRMYVYMMIQNSYLSEDMILFNSILTRVETLCTRK